MLLSSLPVYLLLGLVNTMSISALHGINETTQYDVIKESLQRFYNLVSRRIPLPHTKRTLMLRWTLIKENACEALTNDRNIIKYALRMINYYANTHQCQ